MDLKQVEIYLERYWEGSSTLEEEKYIRDFFSYGTPPPHLEMYRSLFTEEDHAIIPDLGQDFDNKIMAAISEASPSDVGTWIDSVTCCLEKCCQLLCQSREEPKSYFGAFGLGKSCSRLLFATFHCFSLLICSSSTNRLNYQSKGEQTSHHFAFSTQLSMYAKFVGKKN